jgi:hypothetical protein
VKFLQIVVNLLILAAIAAVLLVVASFSPLVQTWAAQRLLNGRPGVRGSVEEVSAGLGRVVVNNLRVEAAGAVLTLPALEARGPVVKDILGRKVAVSSLEAKDWTLDLRQATRRDSRGEAIPGFGVVRALLGLMRAGTIPCEFSLEGVDLEGDVLLAGPPGQATERIRVTLRGGSPDADGNASFSFDANLPTDGIPGTGIVAQGRLLAGMGPDRRLRRLELRSAVTGTEGWLRGAVGTSADVAVVREGPGDRCELDLSRGGRHLVTVSALSPGGAGRVHGSWAVDLQDTEVSPLLRGSTVPPFDARGSGTFDSDPSGTQVHASGILTAAVSHLGALVPSLEVLGTVPLEFRFDGVRTGSSFRFGTLGIAAGGPRPFLSMRAVQAFEIDGASGDVRPADPTGDLAQVAFQSFPLACLPAPPAGFTLDGAANGAFRLRVNGGNVTFRPTSRFTATGVSLAKTGSVLARGLDLSAAVSAEENAQGWRLKCNPLSLSSAGRHLASLYGSASHPPGPEEPVTVAGTWTADLDAIAASPSLPGARGLAGRSASGNFSATVGDTTEIQGKLKVLGHRPGDAATVGGTLDIYDNGSLSFLIPVKLTLADGITDLSIEGTRTQGEGEARTELRVTGDKATLGQLETLAGVLAKLAGGVGGSGTTDRTAFWGDWTGLARVDIEEVTAGDLEFHHAEGKVFADRGSLRLDSVRGMLGDRSVETVEGSVSFDPTARFPYSLKASASLSDVDAGALAPSRKGEDALIEGHFTLERTLAGEGGNREDLFAHAVEEIHLRSLKTGGIVRLLKTTGAVSVPETPAPVSDTLGSVGSSVGSFFGVRKKSGDFGEVRLSPKIQAVLDFADQVSEIGYDHLALDAVRESDGTLDLVSIEMVSPDVRLAGTGRVGRMEGLPLSEQLFTLNLQLGARGATAKLLSTAGLLSDRKDERGYALLNQPVRLGGTLEHLDNHAWREVLSKAAVPDSPAKK